jgi:DNA-binding Lrp family transcriptional regulator
MDKIILLPRERDFIAAVGLCADQSVVSLARHLRVPTHQLHYTIDKLTECGVIRKVWIIDTFDLGITRFNIFFSVSGGDRRKHDQLIKRVVFSPRTVFVAEVGGDFDYELSILARRASEVGSFLRELSQYYGDIFRVHVISTRLSMIHFPRKYLSKHPSLCPRLSIGERSGMVVIDDFDIDILKGLSANPKWSIRELARQIGRAESSVDVRMKRLMREGVIKGAIWSTNSSRYGSQTFKLLVQTRGLSDARRGDMILFATKHPHVTSFIDGFGQWDIELVAEVAEYAELSRLREGLYQHFGDVILEIKLLNRFSVHRYQSFAAV